MTATARGQNHAGVDQQTLADLCWTVLRLNGPQTTGEVLERLGQLDALPPIKTHGGLVKHVERALTSSHALRKGIRREEGRFHDGGKGRPARVRWRAD
jgi:hypothetical protein